MADFDPRQLDQLEDALEGLESIDDLESLELAPMLTERLAEYQDVLTLCREAFPVEEPRAEVLAEVLAEARAVSLRVKPGTADESAWRRFWTRWRGTLIPGVALAGTAAAVLLLLDPGSTPELAQQDEQRSDEREIERTDSTPSEPANMPLGDERGGEEVEIDEVDQPDTDPSEPINTPGSAGVAVKKAKSRIDKSAVPTAVPKPAPEPLSKDDTWILLDRADAERRKGECDQARSHYERVIAAGADNRAIGRAKAGIGLCLEQERRNTEADQWFDQARKSNVGIDAWIAEQRNQQPLPGQSKKAKSKQISEDSL